MPDRPRSVTLRRCRCALLLGLVACAPSFGFEGDVHFGLTKWLGIQAGFTLAQAESIAIGDQRVDAGDMQFIDSVLDYACFERNARVSKEVAAHHYPSDGPVPGPPPQRSVVAGGDAAQNSAQAMAKTIPSQAGFMLYKLGESLHVLQDSFAHQGISDSPQPDPAIVCDPTLAWAHPRNRGGWNSHRADLTMFWPAETMAMAKATYEFLVRYPPVDGVARTPKDWNSVGAELDGFVAAATKRDKQAWFSKHGITDVAFLEGASLKDGAEPMELKWPGRRFPALATIQSTQFDIDAAPLVFFNRFFADWISTNDFDALAAANAAPALKNSGAARGDAFAPLDKVQLAARLRIWRMRDHGAVADLAHTRDRLSAGQLAALGAIARSPAGIARYANPTDAFFPLLTHGPHPSPLLPFIVRSASPSPSGNARAVAIAKLRHAPYDTIAVVAEDLAGQWRVISIVGVVDH